MRIKQAGQDKVCGHHAVVIGAGMAGLLSGRVLADHFEHVTIVERDCLPTGVEARKGVPQGRHVHGLLKKGQSIMMDFFPELCPALLQGGSSDLDMAADMHWYHFGVWKARFPSNITVYSQSRPFLETQVRLCLAAKENVRIIDGCEVSQLCANDDRTRINGVQLRCRTGARSDVTLSADLVIDAGGRGSQAPRWLAALGYAPTEEAVVQVDVGYASRIYRRPSQSSFDWKGLLVSPKPPQGTRAGLIVPIEGDAWMVTLIGWLKDYPPADATDFLEYARTLPVSDLFEAIEHAEPQTAIVTHKFPSNRRRYYERMSPFPAGFVVVGDALCSFNPAYVQGMTVAALEAHALQVCLQKEVKSDSRTSVADLAERLQKRVAKVANGCWLLATSEDFRYPETKGRPLPGTRLFNWYMGRVHELASTDRRTTLRFYEVMNMLRSPFVLFEPHILFAVLGRGLHNHTARGAPARKIVLP